MHYRLCCTASDPTTWICHHSRIRPSSYSCIPSLNTSTPPRPYGTFLFFPPHKHLSLEILCRSLNQHCHTAANCLKLQSDEARRANFSVNCRKIRMNFCAYCSMKGYNAPIFVFLQLTYITKSSLTLFNCLVAYLFQLM